jgi:hypothetical protein
MNLCPSCSRSRWPFVMILGIASVIAFLTWLISGLSDLGALQRIGIALVAFMAVGGTLLHYVLSCLRRHCRHSHPLPGERS